MTVQSYFTVSEAKFGNGPVNGGGGGGSSHEGVTYRDGPVNALGYKGIKCADPLKIKRCLLWLPLLSHALFSAGYGADQCARSSVHRRRASEVLPGYQPSRVPMFPRGA